jgi:RNA polymerase subunit RPABC4/transcription elongation factor Spt4
MMVASSSRKARMMQEMTCPECKSLVQEGHHGHVVNGRRKFCKLCATCAKDKYLRWKRDIGKRAYERDKDSQEKMDIRRKKLQKNNHKRMYGLLSGEYDRLFEEQKGLCACCGNPESVTNARSGLVIALAVDHNHTTGVPRALLCQACNIAYGLMGEDPERIKLLLEYAHKWDETQTTLLMSMCSSVSL